MQHIIKQKAHSGLNFHSDTFGIYIDFMIRFIETPSYDLQGHFTLIVPQTGKNQHKLMISKQLKYTYILLQIICTCDIL